VLESLRSPACCEPDAQRLTAAKPAQRFDAVAIDDRAAMHDIDAVADRFDLR
jgi:hypothetical protein